MFVQEKFPQPSHNVTVSSVTTDLSDYRQLQPGEMIANVKRSLSSSKSKSPPNYMVGKQLQAPRPQVREANFTPVKQLKASPRQDMLQGGMVQLKQTISSTKSDSQILSGKQHPNQTGLPDRLKIGIENLSGYSIVSLYQRVDMGC
ncbi:MAG: hypothetical protein F6J86_08110 [Symploca sp. SIO1B1]|nr:hypothetical protein [Symploca sp. SIO1B1]